MDFSSIKTYEVKHLWMGVGEGAWKETSRGAQIRPKQAAN